MEKKIDIWWNKPFNKEELNPPKKVEKVKKVKSKKIDEDFWADCREEEMTEETEYIELDEPNFFDDDFKEKKK